MVEEKSPHRSSKAAAVSPGMFTKAGGFCAKLAVVPGGGEDEPCPSPSKTSPEEWGEETGNFFLHPAPFLHCSPMQAKRSRAPAVGFGCGLCGETAEARSKKHAEIKVSSQRFI